MSAHAAPSDPLPLQGSSLLSVWEQVQTVDPPERAVRLIAHGWPQLPTPAIWAMNVAERDAHLLRLRAACFGPELEMVFACRACGTPMEMAAPVSGFCSILDNAVDHGEATHDGYLLRVRLSDSADLAAALGEQTDEAARFLLLTRCVDAIDPDGAPSPADRLPREALRAAAEAADALHAGAEILLDNTCPACAAQHSVAFDALQLLWREVQNAAGRLVDDVHELAWAYGWAEQSILTMSPARRQAYLDRVRQ